MDINSQDMKNRTPLFIAIANNMEGVVRLFLKMPHTRLDLNDSTGLAPLSFAIWERDKNTVRLLLERGEVPANTRVLSESLRTAIVRCGHSSGPLILRMLLGMANIDF